MSSILDSEMIKYCLIISEAAPSVFVTDRLEDLELECTKSKSALALIDIRFPGRSAIDLGHRLLENRQVLNVLFMDRSYCRVRASLAKKSGAIYCSRNISLLDLKRIISKLAKGIQLSHLDIASLEVKENLKRVDPSHEPSITTRELEVWTLIGEGCSVADCAEILGIAESTADNHKSRLMKKLRVSKSLELVRMAVRLGMVEP